MSDFLRGYISVPGFLVGVTGSSFHEQTSVQPSFLSPACSSAGSGQVQTQVSSDQFWKGVRGSAAAYLGMDLDLDFKPGAGVPGESFVSQDACLF